MSQKVLLFKLIMFKTAEVLPIRHPRRHNIAALFVNMVFGDRDKIITNLYIVEWI